MLSERKEPWLKNGVAPSASPRNSSRRRTKRRSEVVPAYVFPSQAKRDGRKEIKKQTLKEEERRIMQKMKKKKKSYSL